MENRVTIYNPERRRKIEQGLVLARHLSGTELVRSGAGNVVPPARVNPPALPSPQGDGPIIAELPRWCTRFDLPYMAKYRTRNARFRLIQTFALSETLYDNLYGYDDGRPLILVPTCELGEEHCPRCGAHSTLPGYGGPAYCYQCESWICFSRVDDRFYIECRKSCGNHGMLAVKGPSDEEGFGF
jgi:hypothetical protein